MNTAQKIHYIQSEYDEWDKKECAVTNLQLAVIRDFEIDGFTGSRFFPSETVKDIIYDAINEQTADLLTAMFQAKKDEQKLRDASYAVLNQLTDLIHAKAYEIATAMYNEKEI